MLAALLQLSVCTSCTVRAGKGSEAVYVQEMRMPKERDSVKIYVLRAEVLSHLYFQARGFTQSDGSKSASTPSPKLPEVRFDFRHFSKIIERRGERQDDRSQGDLERVLR